MNEPTSPRHGPSPVSGTWPLLLLFFVAGAPALVYQVVWQRALSLHFGVDIWSTTITVSIFLLGLGIGSLIGGRLADRTARHARLYAWIELGIGLFGLASLSLIQSAGVALAGSPIATLLAVNAALLFVPTCLMGMTLPVMVKLLATRDPAVPRMISRLYGINTLGAACGAALTAYVLLGTLGYAGTTALAAFVNLLLAVAILWLGRVPDSAAGMDTPAGAPEPGVDTRRKARSGALQDPGSSALAHIALLAFLSGFVAIGLEIVLYRVIGIVLHGTVYVFGTHLAVFLTGIAAGSLYAGRHIGAPGALHRFALSQWGIALGIVVVFTVLGTGSGLPGLRHLLAASFFTYFHPSIELVSGQIDVRSVYSLVDIFLWTGVFVLPVALCMGYGFPHLIAAGSHRPETLGRHIGLVYLANIMGSALGGGITGFVLLHTLGTGGTLLVLALAALVTATLAVADKPRAGLRVVLASVVLAGVALAVFPRDGAIVRALHLADFDVVEFQALEDRTGVVALRTQRDTVAFEQEWHIVGQQRLHIDGSTHGYTTAGEIGVDGEVPFALAAHPDPARVLVIGLGDGRMAAAAAQDERVRSVTIVELKQSLATLLADTPQGRILARHADKVHHVVDDGRRWLLANPEQRFEAILMFPLHAAHAHSGSLFSQEFFTLARERLSPGGLLFLKNADYYAMPATLAATFTDLVRLDRETYVASDRPLRFDAARIGRTPEEMLAMLSAGADTIRHHTEGVPLARDLSPQSEFYLTYPWRAALSASATPPYRSDVTDLQRYLEP